MRRFLFSLFITGVLIVIPCCRTMSIRCIRVTAVAGELQEPHHDTRNISKGGSILGENPGSVLRGIQQLR
jgi:hypothetical protein